MENFDASEGYFLTIPLDKKHPEIEVLAQSRENLKRYSSGQAFKVCWGSGKLKSWGELKIRWSCNYVKMKKFWMKINIMKALISVKVIINHNRSTTKSINYMYFKENYFN